MKSKSNLDIFLWRIKQLWGIHRNMSSREDMFRLIFLLLALHWIQCKHIQLPSEPKVVQTTRGVTINRGAFLSILARFYQYWNVSIKRLLTLLSRVWKQSGSLLSIHWQITHWISQWSRYFIVWYFTCVYCTKWFSHCVLKHVMTKCILDIYQPETFLPYTLSAILLLIVTASLSYICQQCICDRWPIFCVN